MSITRFFLARHGETEWNAKKQLQGRLDSPLTEQGIKQAATIFEQIETADIDLIVTSPLGRAHQTALLCHRKIQAPLLVEHQLVERDFGEWQASLFESLRFEEYFEEVFFQVTEHGPPGGESGIECGVRIKDALVSIAKAHHAKHILVITHGDAIRCLHASLNKNSSCDAYSQYGNGRIFPVDYYHHSQTFSIDL